MFHLAHKLCQAAVKAAGAPETLTVAMDITKPEDWARCKDAVMGKFGEGAFFLFFFVFKMM